MTLPIHKKRKENGVNAFGNYINGEFVDSKSGKTFPNVNPANFDEVVGTFQASNEADVNDACAAAVAARDEWAATPATKRGEYLFKAADLLASKLPQLGEEMTRAIHRAVSALSEQLVHLVSIDARTRAEHRPMIALRGRTPTRDRARP